MRGGNVTSRAWRDLVVRAGADHCPRADVETAVAARDATLSILDPREAH
jgi:hypothetical protein